MPPCFFFFLELPTCFLKLEQLMLLFLCLPTCVHTPPPSPYHSHCSHARFAHKVRLKVDWKFGVPIEMFVADSQQNGCQKIKQQAATSHLWLLRRQRTRGGANASTRHAGCAVSAVQQLQLCLLCTSCGPRSVFVVCLSRSLSLSLSGSWFGNFSFVITVSAVDVAMTGKLWTAGEGASRQTTQFN